MSAFVDTLHAARLFVTENLGLKASAIGIAILMFSLVHGAEDMERNVYVDVVVRPPPDAQDMILVTETPDRVRVRLKGSRARLNAIRQENLPAVDVELKTREEPRYYFEKEMFDLPAGVSVMQVVPPSLVFKWVPRAVREVPVEVFLEGKLAPGLQWAGEPEVFPVTIKVDGPRDVVNSMRTVRSMEVDVSELEEGVVQREVQLVAGPSQYELRNAKRAGDLACASQGEGAGAFAVAGRCRRRRAARASASRRQCPDPGPRGPGRRAQSGFGARHRELDGQRDEKGGGDCSGRASRPA